MDANIVLIGFMGTGKSTISEKLRKLYGFQVIEMDQMIAEREQMSIPEIFRTYGESYFRDLETSLLKELQATSHTVISCGGGTAMRDCNVTEMKKIGKVILLTAEPETILKRVKKSNDRPLLEGKKNVQAISELIDQRKEKYEAAADIKVSTDGKNVTDICHEIMEYLG